jgi:hypothetical protein
MTRIYKSVIAGLVAFIFAILLFCFFSGSGSEGFLFQLWMFAHPVHWSKWEIVALTLAALGFLAGFRWEFRRSRFLSSP